MLLPPKLMNLKYDLTDPNSSKSHFSYDTSILRSIRACIIALIQVLALKTTVCKGSAVNLTAKRASRMRKQSPAALSSLTMKIKAHVFGFMRSVSLKQH